MTTPSRSQIGDSVAVTGNVVPSFRTRTVSMCSTGWPVLTLVSMALTSPTRSLGFTIWAGLIFRSQESDGLTDDILAGVAVHLLGSRIPARDGAVERGADDGVAHVLDHSCNHVRTAVICSFPLPRT